MEKTIELILDKISQYNILTNLIPGAVLCILLQYLADYNVFVDSVLLNLFIIYFVGMVNSRVGSIAIEPILKKFHIVKYSSYSDYLEAEKKDPKITMLNQENNVFRSFISVLIISLLAYVYRFYFETICSSLDLIIVLHIFLIVLFCCACHKQTKYIVGRVEKECGQSEKK